MIFIYMHAKVELKSEDVTQGKYDDERINEEYKESRF